MWVYQGTRFIIIMYSGWGGRAGGCERARDCCLSRGTGGHVADILDVLDELGVEEGEAHELGLVQVHHEQLVCWGQICLLAGELLVEVAHVLAMFLENGKLGQIFILE